MLPRDGPHVDWTALRSTLIGRISGTIRLQLFPEDRTDAHQPRPHRYRADVEVAGNVRCGLASKNSFGHLPPSASCRK
jgi:hypothetical protein